MATQTTPPPVESIDYRAAEGFDAAHSSPRALARPALSAAG